MIRVPIGKEEWGHPLQQFSGMTKLLLHLSHHTYLEAKTTPCDVSLACTLVVGDVLDQLFHSTSAHKVDAKWVQH